MARRQTKPRLNPEHEFTSMQECEESDKYGGLHRIEVTTWPPRQKGDELHPTTSARCTRCGCWCIVEASNDPDRSGIEVVVQEREGRAPRPQADKQPA